MRDGKAFGQEVVEVVRGYVDRHVAALEARCASLEAALAERPAQGDPGRDGADGRDGVDGSPGKDGRDASTEAVAEIVSKSVAEIVAGLPKPQDGKDGRDGADGESVTAADLAPLISAEVTKAVAALPPAQKGEPGQDGAKGDAGADGKDADPEVIANLVTAAVKEVVAALPVPKDGSDGEHGQPGEKGDPGEPGQDGKDAEPLTREQVVDAILSMPDVLDEAVARYLAANPPADGKDGSNGADGAPGAPGANGADGRDGKDGQDGSDGIGLAGALITREGALVVTLTNGSTHELGSVVGKDGTDGRDGSAGRDGRDGADGLGFDDLDVAHDGERTITLRFTRGEQTKSFGLEMPVVLDRGVYKENEAYQPGDAVTWAGSVWIAREATTDKPDSGKVWRLAVKRGRDGRDGKDGEKGDRGPEGPRGKDLTQVGPDGSKW